MTTRAAADRRDEARTDYFAMMDGCASRQVIETLSDKWAPLILQALADGPRRRADLSRAVLGATQKMLTQTLRSLERDGLVNRTVTPTVPVRVDYRLTPLGRSLYDLVISIRSWSEAHLAEIYDARARYRSESASPLVL